MNQRQIDTIKNELEKAKLHDDHLESVIANLRTEMDVIREQRDAYRKDCEGHRQMHKELTTEIDGLKNELQRVGRERDAFKAESDDQAKAWAEIRKFIPDVNGISLVEMIRKHVTELKGRISLQKETIETIEKDRAELKDKCENLKSELRLVRGMATPLKREKVFCVGQPIIRILAAKGEWNSDSGGGLVAASDLFGNDPYSKISALECEVERHKRDAKLQYEEAQRQAKRADENYQNAKKLAARVDELEANNRYQRGHTAGYTEALAKVQEQVLKLRV